MMLLDVAPPDFAIVDAWSPVADGPFGVMGCHRPAHVRYLYAGADALSVDEVVLGDLGVRDPRLAPIVRQVYHWFGLSPADVPVDGIGPAWARSSAGPTPQESYAALGAVSYPVYVYLSDHGELFVPAFDTAAFPPLRPIGPAGRCWCRRRPSMAFGIRAP